MAESKELHEGVKNHSLNPGLQQAAIQAEAEASGSGTQASASVAATTEASGSEMKSSSSTEVTSTPASTVPEDSEANRSYVRGYNDAIEDMRRKSQRRRSANSQSYPSCPCPVHSHRAEQATRQPQIPDTVSAKSSSTLSVDSDNTIEAHRDHNQHGQEFWDKLNAACRARDDGRSGSPPNLLREHWRQINEEVDRERRDEKNRKRESREREGDDWALIVERVEALSREWECKKEIEREWEREREREAEQRRVLEWMRDKNEHENAIRREMAAFSTLRDNEMRARSKEAAVEEERRELERRIMTRNSAVRRFNEDSRAAARDAAAEEQRRAEAERDRQRNAANWCVCGDTNCGRGWEYFQ